jgi:hypothetical protein
MPLRVRNNTGFAAAKPLSHVRIVTLTLVAGLLCFRVANAFQTKAAPQPIVIGVVVLTQVPAGQETSGSVTTEPATYESIPGLAVVPATLPASLATPAATATNPAAPVVPSSAAAAAPATSMLVGVVVDIGDGRKQPADRPITWIPPPGEATATLTVFLNGDPQPIATGHVPVDPSPTTPPPGAPTGTDTSSSTGKGSSSGTADASGCAMPSVTTAGGVEVIHGDTSGNSNEMKIAVDGVPASIVAAKPGTVFWNVSETLAPGLHRVVFTPGPGKPPVVLMLYVLALQMSADQTKLLKGQSTKMHVVVLGLDKIPASVWQQADAPPSDLEDLAKFLQHAPGVQLPKAGDPGTLILVIDNLSPQTIRMGKKGSQIVLTLHQEDFASGTYRYDDTIQSLQDGGFNITGSVTALMKLAASQPAGPSDGN